MITPNPYLENLQERVVQERVLKLIHANNPFQIFAKTNIEYNGAFGEYIGTQPLEGVKWKKELTGEDFKKLPEVFSCRLPIILDNVYPSIQNKQVMKRALQSSILMAELSERLIDDIKTQATRDIKKKVLEKLCPTDPTDIYHDNAITNWEQGKIDSLDKAIEVINWIYEQADNLLEESVDFNKGYQKLGSNDWNEVITNSESYKDLVVYISPDWFNALRVRFLSDVADNKWVDLKNDFAEVKSLKLPGTYKIMIRDKESFAYTIIAEEGINSELIAASGSTKFYFHPTMIGGIIPFKNASVMVDGTSY